MTPQLYFSDVPKTKPPRGSRQQLPGQELVGLGTPERSSPALLAIEEPGPGVPQAPWSLSAALGSSSALADPRKHPGRHPSGCSVALPDALTPAGAVPSLPTPGEPREPGSDPPDTAAFADIWCLLFVFGLVWEGSTLNSWSF